jgi:hypothetical protein
MSYDALTTGLARALKMRKALITVPLFWEVRMHNALDDLADSGCRDYHHGV